MANKRWIGTDGNYGTAANWSPTNVPVAADNVVIPAGGSSITSGLNQSAVAIGSFTVEEGFSGTIGSATGYLQIDPDSFTFEGTGLSFIDIGSAAIDPEIVKTASASTGYFGLYLKGSAIDVLNVLSGSVGVAVQLGETSAVTTVRCIGSSALVTLGVGVTDGIVVDQFGGTVESYTNVTTATLNGGNLYLYGDATNTTTNLKGGALIHNSSGTVTTINAYSGTADWQKSGIARTVTTINVYKGGTVTLKLNKAAVTYTNGVTPQDSATFITS